MILQIFMPFLLLIYDESQQGACIYFAATDQVQASTQTELL